MAKGLAGILVLCLVGKALSVPLDVIRNRRGFGDNVMDTLDRSRRDNDEPSRVPMNPALTLSPIKSSYEDKKRESQTPDPFDDDDEDWEPMQAAPTGGGSNILSILNLANGLFSGSSGPSRPQSDQQAQQQTSSPLWTLKMDIIRAFLQFGARMLGMASQSSANALNS